MKVSTLAWKIPWTEELVGCSPWGRWGLDTTEQLHFHFSLSCIGEGNGNPLQCSCLENPRDGGAGWAAVYGVTQSQTWLKQLSSSMVFPVVMFGFESWTIKKAEHWRIDGFELWCWRKLLRVPWTARWSNQSILKPPDLLEKTLMLGKIEGRRRRWQRMRRLDGITDLMDVNLSKL